MILLIETEDQHLTKAERSNALQMCHSSLCSLYNIPSNTNNYIFLLSYVKVNLLELWHVLRCSKIATTNRINQPYPHLMDGKSYLWILISAPVGTFSGQRVYYKGSIMCTNIFIFHFSFIKMQEIIYRWFYSGLLHLCQKISIVFTFCFESQI